MDIRQIDLVRRYAHSIFLFKMRKICTLASPYLEPRLCGCYLRAMKFILSLALLLPLVAQAKPELMICELELQNREALLAAGRKFDQAIVGQTFRVVAHAQRAALVELFGLPADPSLKFVTFEFRPTQTGYRMILNGPKGEVRGNFDFEFPPLLAWPRVVTERRKLAKYYEDTEDPFVDDDIIDTGIFYGAILTNEDGARSYLEFKNMSGDEVLVEIGVDLPANVKIAGEKGMLLRHPGGWYRRSHILVLGHDSPSLRHKLKIHN